MIAEFLDQQQWKDHSISFLLPAEDVSFRKITFPFQERKKVEQALPYELEEELMSDLSESAYSVQVFTMPEQNSEALGFVNRKGETKAVAATLSGTQFINSECRLFFSRPLQVHDEPG